MDKRALSSLDEIRASKALKQNTLNYVMKKKPAHKRGFAVSILVVMSCILLVFIPKLTNSDAPISPLVEEYAYVSMDINPSFELTLDKHEMVIAITSFNKEAQEILDTLDLNNKHIDDAVALILHQEVFQSYLRDGFLQVSVAAKDNDTSTRLETSLRESLSQYLDTEQYGCSHSTLKEKETAMSHHMSFGKYQIVESIIELDSTYAIETLQNDSMRTLMNLYEEVSGETYQNKACEQNHGQHNNGNGKGNGDGNGKQHQGMK